MISTLSLTGCVAAPSDQASAVPDVQEYGKDAQLRAAGEIAGGTCPVLGSFMIDYLVMRDQARELAKP